MSTRTLGTALEAIIIDRNGERRHATFPPRSSLRYSANGRRLVICGDARTFAALGDAAPLRIEEIAYRHVSAGPCLHKFGRRGARMTFNARTGCLSITGVNVAPFIAD